MSLFDKAKMVKADTRLCRNCKKEFKPDKRNLNRGWGMCCSKSCAATYKVKLDKMKPLDKKREIRDLRISQLGL
jgi:hypothetical protein